jgi:hypothetical protein
MPSYRRVAATESGDDGSTASSLPATHLTRSLSDRWMDKLVALAWIMLAWFVMYWTRFTHVILSSRDANRSLISLAFLCMGTNTVLFLYLTVYLPRFKGLTDSSAWDVYCPRVIPTMTGIGVLTALLLIRGTWPVWGFLSPLILGTEFVGLLYATHFIPWF